MSEIIIERAQTGVSLQDAGRKGFLRYGVARAGPMDWARHAMANQILGKPLSSTAIEVGPAGMDFTLKSGTLQVSFVGPRYRITIDDVTISCPMRTTLVAGQRFNITPNTCAMWGYLSVQGRVDLPKYLGSHADNSVSGMRAISIQPGMPLSILDDDHVNPKKATYVDPYIAYEPLAIGIVPSSQYVQFSAQMKEQLVNQMMMIEPRFNRMAYRLRSAHISCDKGHDILSDSVTMGAIQVPGDGQPFVLMADHQTTGGYPKIACVCKADLPRFAQMAPNKPFSFRWKTVDQAFELWSVINQQIASMRPLTGL